MKIVWVRLIALLYAVVAIVLGVGHYLDKTREPLAGMIFAQVCVVLMIVAALADRQDKRIANLEKNTNVSETKDA
jgi:hypothetical protein